MVTQKEGSRHSGISRRGEIPPDDDGDVEMSSGDELTKNVDQAPPACGAFSPSC